jgi:hypothetical protein
LDVAGDAANPKVAQLLGANWHVAVGNLGWRLGRMAAAAEGQWLELERSSEDRVLVGLLMVGASPLARLLGVTALALLVQTHDVEASAELCSRAWQQACGGP